MSPTSITKGQHPTNLSDGDGMKVTQNGLGPWEKDGNRLLNVKINSYFQEVGTPPESANHIMLLKVTAGRGINIVI